MKTYYIYPSPTLCSDVKALGALSSMGTTSVKWKKRSVKGYLFPLENTRLQCVDVSTKSPAALPTHADAADISVVRGARPGARPGAAKWGMICISIF